MSLSLSIYNFIVSNIWSTILLLISLNIAKHIYQTITARKRLPPGPTGLPIVGYLPFLGKHPHKEIAKLGQKYGSVFTLQLGIHNVVILNDWESVNDAFHKDAFLGRPDYTPFDIVADVKSFAGENNDIWKEHRRFSLQILRDLGFGKGSMEERITDEIQYLLDEIDKHNDRDYDIHKTLTPSMSNNISHLVFGHRYDYDNPGRSLLDKSIDSASKVFSVLGIFAVSPRWFGRLLFKIGEIFRSKDAFKPVNDMFENEIEEHKKSLNKENIRDYIDGYLVEMEIRKKKDPNTSITFGKLNPNLRAFFGAGSETVRTSTEWNLLLVAGHQSYQQIIHEEIDSVIGRERKPTFDDRLRMPFTMSFLNEVFRWKTIVSLNVMRRSLEDTSVLGHFIPKDTHVLANIYAVHNDPKVWDNPEKFDAKRFLNDKNELIKKDALIPFSVGKRSCIGETLARVEVFLYFTSILQRYQVSPPENHVFSYDDDFGLALRPKNDVILKFKIR